MDFKNLAMENIKALSQNPYPGRGIILGRTPDGDPVQIYWIMGRSESSRDRILQPVTGKGGWLRTKAARPSELSPEERKLLIYTAMAERQGFYIVSNGRQTVPVLHGGISALKSWQYEDDSPNFTPRIVGVTERKKDGIWTMQLVILRKSQFGGDECERIRYNYDAIPSGYGLFISTYKTDGKPLSSFNGEPQIMPIRSNYATEIDEAYWSALNTENRVALAVKIIRPDLFTAVSIINRYQVGK